MLATGVAALLVGMVLSPVVGELFVEAAREKGLYEHPSQRLGAAMSALNSIVSQQWFIGLTLFFVGLAAGTWLDLLLGRRERRRHGDPILTREIIRFLDIRALPTLEYWYDGLSCRKNWRENTSFPRDMIVQRMCLIADLEIEEMRIRCERARSLNTVMTVYDLQILACDAHRALMRLIFLHDLYSLLDPPGWVVEDSLERYGKMEKYYSALDDLARDSHCGIIKEFVNDRERYP